MMVYQHSSPALYWKLAIVGEERRVKSEEALAAGLKKKDPEAWTRLYEEYFSRIYRYIAVRVGNRTEAEDLAERVFLKALEAGTSFRWRGAPVSSWLFRIARNVIIDHRRTDKGSRMVPLDDVVIAEEMNPHDVAVRRSDVRRVMTAVDGLSQAQREVIELRFAGELSTKEVAKVLGKSEGAVRVLQHNALVALRKKLSGWEDGG
jgi:RNA polymerase sigma-70 factor (ECF subfamily)